MAFNNERDGFWENELVEVKSMSTPTRQIFYLDYVYGESTRKDLAEKWKPTDRFL